MPRQYKPMPDLAELLEYFELNAAEGTLTRIKNRQGCQPSGTVIKGAAGYYRRVYFKGRALVLSRVIWYMATGEDPGQHQIDHIDGDISNNAISNLRKVTQAQNNINKKSWAKSGHKGVYVRYSTAGRPRYYVQVHRTDGKREDGTYRRKTTSHGIYDTPEEAAAVYAQVLREQHAEAVEYTREGDLDDSSCDDDISCDDDMDGDHASALESAGWGDEPMGYEAGEWL